VRASLPRLLRFFLCISWLLLFFSAFPATAQTNPPPGSYIRSFVADVPDQPLITVSVTGAVGVACFTIEETVPAPATAVVISGGGIYLPGQNVVRWGPFFNTPGTNVTYRITGLPASYPIDGGAWMDGQWYFSPATTMVPVLPPAGGVQSPPPQVATPTFSPSSGASVPTNVTISCTTTGAVIYYTLDGSLPTQASTAYTGQVLLASAGVLRAGAFTNGWTPSVAYYGPPAAPANAQVARSINTNVPTAPVVTLNVSPGAGASCVAVTEFLPPGVGAINVSSGGNYIASNNVVLWGPFFGTTALSLSYQAVGQPGVYPARAAWSVDGVGGGETTGTNLVIASGAGGIIPTPPQQVTTPVLTPTVASNLPVTVSISCGDAQAQVYYTTNGTLPTQSSTLCTGPLTFNTQTSLRARAFHFGYLPSTAAVGEYVPVPTANTVSLARSIPGNGSFLPTVLLTATLQGTVNCYSVVITNAFGSVTSATATLTVTCPAITVGLAALADGALGVYYNQTINSSGGVAPCTYAKTSGALPSGLSLTTNGSLTGIPFALGTNTFTVTVTDANGCTGSATCALAILPSGSELDTNNPTVTITSPANKATVTSASVTVSGTAKDITGSPNTGVALVLYSLNGGAPQLASTTNQFAKWTADVTLIPGTNAFAVQSVDFRGNVSPIITNRYFFKVLWPLTVITNGNGKVSIANGSSLILTKNYAITATPGANTLFTNWTASVNGGPTNVVSGSVKYTFQMQSNHVLIANFVTNQFLGAAGSYYGLFWDTNSGVAHSSAGFMKVTVNSPSSKPSTFSGKLSVEGQTHSFSGSLDVAGDGTSKPVTRKNKTPLSVQLHLPADDTVSGRVSNSDGSWVAQLSGNRAVFKTTTNPATNYVGKYTLVLPNLTSDYTNSFVLNPGNKFVVTNTPYGQLYWNNLRVTPKLPTGLVRVSFKNPGNTNPVAEAGLRIFAAFAPWRRKLFAWSAVDSLREELLDFLDHFHKPIHLGLGVVEIEAGPGGGFHAQPVHERLRAVMPAAQRHARLVREHHHIVRMHVRKQEAHEAGALLRAGARTEEPDILQRGKLVVGVVR
jgi:hypothetical protein